MESIITDNYRVNQSIKFIESLSVNNDICLYSFFGKTTDWTKTYLIENIEQTNPLRVYIPNHDLEIGNIVKFNNVVNISQINELEFQITGISDNYIEFDDIDGTGFSFYQGNGTITQNIQVPVPKQSDNIWDSLIGLKRIEIYKAVNVAKRINWESSKIYDIHGEGDTFYVLTGQNRVYKCLDNLSRSFSTIEPTHTFNYPKKYTDGYVWQYMFEIPIEDLVFLTDNWIPVRNEYSSEEQQFIQEASIPGTIDSIQVIDGGSGYSDINTISLDVFGDGENLELELKSSDLFDGKIINVDIKNRGYGYTTCQIVARDSNNIGHSAIIKPIISYNKGNASQPIHELNATYVMVNIDYELDEDGQFMVNNDYKIFGIMTSPITTDNQYAKNLIYDLRTNIDLINVSGEFNNDDYIIGSNSGATGIITDVNANNIKVIEVNGEFINGEEITSEGSGIGNIINITYSDIIKNTSDILYIEYLDGIIRSPLQTENNKLIFEF